MKKTTGEKELNRPISPASWFSNPPAWLPASLVAALTFAALYPSLQNSFINWDDNAYVFENAQLQRPLADALAYFFGPHTFIGNYTPLTMTAYALINTVAGLDPYYFHLANLLLHSLNTLLVFAFIYRLCSKDLLVAALTAVLFGVHPMHVESVAWVAELKDVLYTCFFLSGLIMYQQYTRTDKRPISLIALTFFAFVLSVLSKPAAIVFPLVLLLLDLWYERPVRRAVGEKIPFFIVSLLMGVVAIKAQAADRLLYDPYQLGERVLFAIHSFIWYLVKAVAPSGLSIFHPYPVSSGMAMPPDYYLAPVVLALIGFALYKLRRHSRATVFGMLFFAVNIALVLQVVGVGYAIVAERYTYVSYIGLFFALASGGVGVARSWGKRQPFVKPVLAVTAAAAIIGCCSLSYARCMVWANDETIGADLLEKYPEDWLALNNMGFIRYTQGRYPEARELLQKAVERRPAYTMASINLANAWLAMNQAEEAARVTESALRYEADNHHLLNLMGYLMSRSGKNREATGMHEAAIKAQPNDLDGYIQLAERYYALKEYEKGIAALDRGLNVFPDHYILLNNKGYYLYTMQQYEAALQCLKASLKQQPGYEIARANAENCYRALAEQAGPSQ